jgi:hypothetical protein
LHRREINHDVLNISNADGRARDYSACGPLLLKELAFEYLALQYLEYLQAQIGADLHQVLSLHVILGIHVLLPLKVAIVRSIERGLEGAAIYDGEFAEHHKSRRRFLLLLVGELAVVQLEKLISLPQHVRNHPDQVVVLVVHQVILGGDAPIHEDVPLP